MEDTTTKAAAIPATTIAEQVSDAKTLVPLGLANKVRVNPHTGTITVPLDAKTSVEAKVTDASALATLLVMMGERLAALDERVSSISGGKK